MSIEKSIQFTLILIFPQDDEFIELGRVCRRGLQAGMIGSFVVGSDDRKGKREKRKRRK